jgi:hypothetical protein
VRQGTLGAPGFGSPLKPVDDSLAAALAANSSLNPRPNADLKALRGTVDAGAAGVRVAGNLNVAALRVLNADQFEVGGVAVGLPQVTAPNIGGLLQGSAAAGASQQDDGPKTQAREQPSIIIVEVIGYGGGGPNEQPCPDGRPRVNGVCADRAGVRQSSAQDPASAVQIMGEGPSAINAFTSSRQ